MSPTRRQSEKILPHKKSIDLSGDALQTDGDAAAQRAGGSHINPQPSAQIGVNNPRRAAQASAPVSDEASKPQGDNAPKDRPTAAQKAGGSRKARMVVAAALAVVLVLLASFAAFHWLYGNDAQDLQGTWYVNGTSATISITESEIVLTDEVSYGYEIDPFAKTMSFSFSKLQGGGHYRFSLDRGEVAIIDGEFTWLGTLVSDSRWLVGALVSALQGEEALPAAGEQVTLLSRELPDASAPSAASDLSAGEDAAESASSESGAGEGLSVEAEQLEAAANDQSEADAENGVGESGSPADSASDPDPEPESDAAE